LAVPRLPKPDADEPAREKIERISLQLGKDGRIAFDSLRPATRDKFAALLADPEARRTFGLTSDAQGAPAAPAEPAIPTELIRPQVGLLSALETALIARVTKAPADLVTAIAPYTPAEIDAIAPALGAVINKHVPAGWTSKYGEEAALVVLLGSFTYQKITAIRDATDRRGPARVLPHTPATTPAAPAAPTSQPSDVDNDPLAQMIRDERNESGR
jgi:hypothetical protein